MFVGVSIKEVDMPRNLDLTALRSFLTVAEVGGVTKASGLLNVTQSAVSMQLKRLEDSLGQKLLDRTHRNVSTTAAGDQLLSYARRMLELNDEVLRRMTDNGYQGEVTLGVPHDIVYPAIPKVLAHFAADFPRMKVHLLSGYTRMLKDCFARGECDFILTTENGCESGGETLVEKPLIWIGMPGGSAWKQRPLRLAFSAHCIFRRPTQRRLDAAGIPWEMAVESESERSVEATVSADLAVQVMLEGTEPGHTEAIRHNGALPDLMTQKINLYVAETANGPAAKAMVQLIRRHYQSM